jgi:hypothetical protein
MNKKMLVLIALLLVGGSRVLAYSSQKGRPDGYLYALPVQSPGQPVKPAPGMEQRSLFRHCIYTAELARKHLDELVRTVTRSPTQANEVQQHLREVRNAVSSMLEDHHRFLGMLTEEQWTTAKDAITRLEQLRATINAQLKGFDDELRMPEPDSKILARYAKRTEKALQEWQKQHRKVGAAIGMRDL